MHWLMPTVVDPSGVSMQIEDAAPMQSAGRWGLSAFPLGNTGASGDWLRASCTLAMHLESTASSSGVKLASCTCGEEASRISATPKLIGCVIVIETLVGNTLLQAKC